MCSKNLVQFFGKVKNLTKLFFKLFHSFLTVAQIVKSTETTLTSKYLVVEKLQKIWICTKFSSKFKFKVEIALQCTQAIVVENSKLLYNTVY